MALGPAWSDFKANLSRQGEGWDWAKFNIEQNSLRLGTVRQSFEANMDKERININK